MNCEHPPYELSSSGHCAEMLCSNYINKCPNHGMPWDKSRPCSNEENEKTSDSSIDTPS